MIVGAHVTRKTLGLADLDLLSSIHRMTDRVDFGPLTWNRITTQSIFVHGTFPVMKTKAESQMSLGFNVLGATQTALANNINTLVTAFYEDNYELHISYDGVDWAWKCYAAEVLVGAMDDRFDLLNVEVRMSVPRHPVPVAGPF